MGAPAGAAATLRSPDGRLTIDIETVVNPAPNTAGGQLVYSVTFEGKPLVDESALKLELEGQRPLGTDVRIVHASTSATDSTYRLITGKTSEVRDHYNAVRIDLEETGGMGRRLAMEARAYDDAVAFRYVVPKQNALREFRLTKEDTEFRIAKDATTYALELPNYRSMYESEFVKLAAQRVLQSRRRGEQGIDRAAAVDGGSRRGLDGDHRGRPARLRCDVSGESFGELGRPLVRIARWRRPRTTPT